MSDARTVDSNGNFSGPSSTDEGGSGIAEYQISKDNHTWVTYKYTYHQNDIYQVSANGENHRYFRAKDHAGNYSDVKERAIYIDKAAPVMNDVVLTHSYNGEKPNGSRAEVYTPGSWINKNVYMTDARTVTNGHYSDPTATDTGGSNLKKIQITNANDCNSNWVDYAYDYHQELYDITQNGNHTRCFRAIDNAGNTSTVVTKNIKIDKIGPTVSLEVIKQGTSTRVKQSSDYVGTNNTKFDAGTYTYYYRFYVNGTDSSCGMKDEFMTDMSTTAGTKQKPNGSERYSVYFNDYKSYDGIITVKDKCGNETKVPFSITQNNPCSESNPFGCNWTTACRDGKTTLYTIENDILYEVGFARHGGNNEDKIYLIKDSNGNYPRKTVSTESNTWQQICIETFEKSGYSSKVTQVTIGNKTCYKVWITHSCLSTYVNDDNLNKYCPYKTCPG